MKAETIGVRKGRNQCRKEEKFPRTEQTLDKIVKGVKEPLDF